jgi:large subunit ribosomal protein L30
VAAERTKTRRTASAPKLRVTWVRSTIGHTAATRGTIRALGLRRLHQTVEIADTPENRGMLRRAAFLLAVEEPAGGAKGASAKEEESA